MIFAKIDFINLLPFDVFIKKNIKSSQIKQIINYKKSYPSKINTQFINRKIDCAFISSIASINKKTLPLGIVAKDEVLSVLVLSKKQKDDYQSETSNALAKVLNINGQILIGDKALKYYYENRNDTFKDLASIWKEKYNLPFVFAILSYNKHEKYLKNIVIKFNKSNTKIPTYILNKYCANTDLSQTQIKNYLSKITYTIGYKEKQSLKLFFKLLKQKRIK
jgi:chorismate dehydratase